MSSVPLISSFLSEDQFQCPICLDVFTNPASTPCGHSFCMACICCHWDGARTCQCPLCNSTFPKRPDLKINRTLREITDQYKTMTGWSRGSSVRRPKAAGGGGGGGGGKRGGGGGKRGGGGAAAQSGDIFTKLRMRRPRHSTVGLPGDTVTLPVRLPPSSSSSSSSSSSFLTASLFGHQQRLPPSRAPASPPPAAAWSRRRFTVCGAVDSQLPLCERHHRGLQVYCRTDRLCICPDCEAADHQGHDTVSVEREWLESKSQLNMSEMQFEIDEMIEQRLRKVEEITASVAELQRSVERETTGSMSLYSESVRAVERSQAELLEVIGMNHRAADHRAAAAIGQLEQEVAELRTRGSALSELDQSEDYVHCIKTFPALCTPPPTRDWSGVCVTSDLGTGDLYRSLATTMDKFQEELMKMAETGFPAPPAKPSAIPREPKIKRVEEYAVNVTLDSSTAHPRLILSEDRKRVKCGDRLQPLPDNPERFDRVMCVLGLEAFSSGRYYWEVEVGKKTDWDLGVARRPVNRKGRIEITPSNGYWFLSLRESTALKSKLRPKKIGVFLDYEKGQVSFYNVDAKLHIYTFMDSFSECVFPFFSPGSSYKSSKNDAPLVITPMFTD